nr:hypothetical protein [Tanacetum cinerariifolium]
MEPQEDGLGTNQLEVILFYKGLDVPTRQILDSKGAMPKMNATDANKAIQEMVDHSQKWHNGTSTRCRSSDTSDGLVAIQAKLNNLGGKLRRNQEVDDLGSTIKEGEVIYEPMMDIIKTRNDDEMIDGVDEYSSFSDFNRKIHIDCGYNL